MKFTLLELTQEILSSMDSDEINSINDSVESQQVAKIIRQTYFDIINRANLPENYSLKNLQASGDGSKPAVMYVPSDVASVKWLKYDSRTTADSDVQYELITFQSMEEFLNNMDMMDQDATNVGSTTLTNGTSSSTFMYWTDRAPKYCTSYDDFTIVFDAYDKTVDNTLQSSKSRAYCKLIIPFSMVDTFTPSLDEPQFQLLLNEAKSLAWAELRQSAHPKAEQNAKRGWTELNKTKFAAGKVSDFDQIPDFGRRGSSVSIVRLH